MVDEWSGFADLLANLIGKYASVLEIERMPAHLIVLDTEKNKNSINSASIPVEDKNAALYNRHEINVQTYSRGYDSGVRIHKDSISATLMRIVR